MFNLKFVLSGSNFAQFSKTKKLASSPNLKTLTQKTKNQGNYQVSRRFEKYSFQWCLISFCQIAMCTSRFSYLTNFLLEFQVEVIMALTTGQATQTRMTALTTTTSGGDPSQSACQVRHFRFRLDL